MKHFFVTRNRNGQRLVRPLKVLGSPFQNIGCEPLEVCELGNRIAVGILSENAEELSVQWNEVAVDCRARLKKCRSRDNHTDRLNVAKPFLM